VVLDVFFPSPTLNPKDSSSSSPLFAYLLFLEHLMIHCASFPSSFKFFFFPPIILRVYTFYVFPLFTGPLPPFPLSGFSLACLTTFVWAPLLLISLYLSFVFRPVFLRTMFFFPSRPFFEIDSKIFFKPLDDHTVSFLFFPVFAIKYCFLMRNVPRLKPHEGWLLVF